MPPITATAPVHLGDILLREGLINQEQYNQGVREFELTEKPLSRIFVEMGAITEGMKLGLLQKRLDCQLISIKDTTPRPEAADVVPRTVCEKHHLVPLRIEKGRIVVAMEDPTDIRAIAAVETSSSMQVAPFLAKSEEIHAAIERLPRLEGPADSAAPSPVYVILSKITLPVLSILPIAVFYYLLLFQREFQKYWDELDLDTFTSVLMFVLASSAWSIIMFWIDGVLFRRNQQQA